MSVFCACGEGGVNGNTGRSSAELVQSQTFGYFLFPAFADDGTENVINANDFQGGKLPATFIQQKINEADESKRWRPILDFKSTTNERADPNTEQPTGGNAQITDLGVRSLMGQIWNTSPKLKKNLVKLACKKLAFIYIDRCGTIWGNVSDSEPEVFRGILIADRTFESRYVAPTEGVVAKIDIMFEVDQIEDDGNLCAIPAGAIESNLLKVNGLLNALVTITSPTTTGFTAKINLEYGGFANIEPVTGLVLADFLVTNLTANAVVVPTSVTESLVNKGSYDFVLPAQTANDVVSLSGAVVSGGALDGSYLKQGFEIVERQATLL